jgi:aminoglycoside 6'-N-acetyltransferase I
MASPAIRLAQDSDRVALAKMRAALWPDASFEDHLKELESGPVGSLPTATFVAHAEGGVVGFLDAGLRSHADGCDPATRRLRRRLVRGRTLPQAWSRRGSDASGRKNWREAHQALGFEVVDRCVHFRKKL